MSRFMDIFSLYELACALLPCLVYQLFFVVRSKKTGRKVSGVYLAWVWIFLVYIWMVLDVTGIGTLEDIWRYIGYGESPFVGGYNFVPFDSIGIGFILNIVMFMPFGFLLPLIWKDFRNIKKTAAAGAVFSLIIELTQIFNFRATDVDDLLTNTCGACAGYLIWRIFVKMFGEQLNSAKEGWQETVRYVLLAVAGVFFLYHPFLIIDRMM